MLIDVDFGTHDEKRVAAFFLAPGASRSVIPNLSTEAVEEIAAAIRQAYSYVEAGNE